MGTAETHWPLTILGSISSLVNVFLPFVLVRLLDSESYGNYKIFFLYLSFMPWLSMASGYYQNLSYWTQSKGQGESDSLNIYTSLSVTWLYLHALLVLCAAAIFFLLFPKVMASVGHGRILFPLAAGLSLLSNLYEYYQISKRQFVQSGFFTLGYDYARTLLMVAVAYFSQNLDLVIVTYVFVLSLKCMHAYFYLHQEFQPKLLLKFKAYFSEISRQAWPSSMASALATLTLYSDQIIMSTLLTAGHFAFFTIGCLALPPLNIFEQSVNKSLVLDLIQAIKMSSPGARLSEIYKKSMIELGRVIIPIVVFLFYFSPQIISLLFSEKYIASSMVLNWFCFSYLLFMLPFDVFFKATGRTSIIMKLYLATAILSVIGVGFGTYFWSWKGAIVGSIFARTIQRVFGLYLTGNEMHISWYRLIPWFSWLRVLSISLLFIYFFTQIQFAFADANTWFLTCAFIMAMFLGLSTFVYWRLKSGVFNRGVLYLSQYFGLGGLERMVYNLLKLGRDDASLLQSVLFVYDRQNDADNLLDEAKVNGLQVIECVKPSGFSFRLMARLINTLLSKRINIIHSHDLGPLIYAVLSKIILGFQIRIIHTQHSFVHLKKAKRYQFYERLFTSFVDELVVVSPDLGYRYLEIGVGRRIHCIHNGVEFPKDLPSFYEKRRAKLLLQSELAHGHEVMVSMDRIWVLCLGRIHRGKGQDLLAQMWTQLPAEVQSKFALFFVGSVTDANFGLELEKKIEPLQPQNVYFLGATHQPEKWILASEIFISTSEFEGHPLAPTEALAGGCHLILSEIPGHEVFRNFADLIKRNDTEGLSRVLQEILRTTEKRKYNSEDWQNAQCQWSSKQMYQDYKELYFPFEGEIQL